MIVSESVCGCVCRFAVEEAAGLLRQTAALPQFPAKGVFQQDQLGPPLAGPCAQKLLVSYSLLIVFGRREGGGSFALA